MGGGLCKKDEAEKSASTNELGLANVGGVFLVLMCGCGASLIIAICEFLWNVRKVAVREKVRPSLSSFSCPYFSCHVISCRADKLLLFKDSIPLFSFYRTKFVLN